MGKMKWHRFQQIIQYGWKDSKEISHNIEINKSRIAIFLDILACYKRYYLFSNQYKKNRVWDMSKNERNKLLISIGKSNKERDNQIDEQYANRKFLTKYMSHKYQSSSKLIQKRLKAYTKRYHFGKNCMLQHNVEITTQHCMKGSISVGNNVLFAKNVFIDYSGEVVISDNVKISAGVTIESHRHEFTPGAKKQNAVPTKIVIEDGVWIGQRAIICEDCKRIGRYAQIGAGAVVRNPIPPYAIVVGNPAKIVGFLLTPQEMKKFEETHFPDSFTDFNQYEANYNKYFINRINNIKQLLRN